MSKPASFVPNERLAYKLVDVLVPSLTPLIKDADPTKMTSSQTSTLVSLPLNDQWSLSRFLVKFLD